MLDLESAISKLGRNLDTSLKGRAYLRSDDKRQFDKKGTAMLLPVATPVIRAAALAVRAYDHESPLITLPRVGYGGKEFGQYKVRSMLADTDPCPILSHIKSADDDRITPIGKIIRKLSIDELPQLQNVKEGTMSLVGPRPKSRQEFDAFCEMDDGFEAAYTAALPGMTGMEQIGGRGEATPQERVDAARYYADEACAMLDAKILKATARIVLSAHGAY
jgi:lipopolysaccharide/colanic/teichoic acid biosynthesis glycosyltransferase